MDINNTIKRIKEIVRKITSLFPYSEEDINYLTLAYLAMYLLDPTIEDLIEEVLSTTYIHLTDNPICVELKKLLPNHYKKFEKTLKDSDGGFEGIHVVNGELVRETFIIIEKYSLDTNYLMDVIMHEIKHAINEIFIKAYGSSYYYSGLSLIFEDIIIGENLDEAFNSYLSGLYVEILISLKKHHITDPGIARIINSLEETDFYSYSYGELVECCCGIFESKICFWALYNAAIYKDMVPLYETIEYAFDGLISWESFLRILDDENPEELKQMQNRVLYQRIKEEMRIPRI